MKQQHGKTNKELRKRRFQIEKLEERIAPMKSF